MNILSSCFDGVENRISSWLLSSPTARPPKYHPTHQDKKRCARWPHWIDGWLGVYGSVSWILHGLICLPWVLSIRAAPCWINFSQSPRLLVRYSIIVRDPISGIITVGPTDANLVSTFESEVRSLFFLLGCLKTVFYIAVGWGCLGEWLNSWEPRNKFFSLPNLRNGPNGMWCRYYSFL